LKGETCNPISERRLVGDVSLGVFFARLPVPPSRPRSAESRIRTYTLFSSTVSDGHVSQTVIADFVPRVSFVEFLHSCELGNMWLCQ
jgi:hypothetical protein